MGFEEISHTADWSLRAWGDDLSELFIEAARGMNMLAGVQLSDVPRQRRTVEIKADDHESLLVSFLSELVYLAEQENLGFDRFDLAIQNNILHASMHGAPLGNINKTIKAVTYHNLHIQQTTRGLEVVIVFDV